LALAVPFCEETLCAAQDGTELAKSGFELCVFVWLSVGNHETFGGTLGSRPKGERAHPRYRYNAGRSIKPINAMPKVIAVAGRAYKNDAHKKGHGVSAEAYY
jgi:hypothetical protein